jgi:hypothetical protein
MTSESLRTEAALCIWEEMLDIRWNTPLEPKPYVVDMVACWEDNGSSAMRSYAQDLAKDALAVFDLIGQHEGMEALDMCAYDWEFMPAFVARVDWSGSCPVADPKTIAAQMTAKVVDDQHVMHLVEGRP